MNHHSNRLYKLIRTKNKIAEIKKSFKKYKIKISEFKIVTKINKNDWNNQSVNEQKMKNMAVK